MTSEPTPDLNGPAELIDGPRACAPYELPQVLDLINLVFRIDAAKLPTMGRDWAQIYRPSNLDNVRILKINHQLVCSISIYPTDVKAGPVRLRVGGINAVATDPDFRKRGLGGGVLRDCHATMRRDGCDVGLLSTLITDWYRRFGWENGALRRTFMLDRNTIAYLPRFDAELVHGPVFDRDGIRALHDREPFGAERDPETYQVLLERPQYHVYTARRGGETIAYAVVRDDYVYEYGGATEDVAALIGAIYRWRDDPTVSTSTYERGRAPRAPTPRLEVETPPNDTGLGGHLRRLGIPAHDQYLGMMRIINAGQLLGKIAPRLAVEHEQDDTITLRDGSERLTLSPRELVKLCFGPERVFQFAADLLPVPLYQWRLDRV